METQSTHEHLKEPLSMLESMQMGYISDSDLELQDGILASVITEHKIMREM